jgi:osmotically-inducible protein OsmY/uncharacterized protein YrrD
MNLTFFAIVIMGGWVVAIAVAGLVMVLRPGGAAIKLAGTGGGSAGAPIGPRDEIRLGGDAEVLGNIRGRVEAVQLQPGSRELQGIELATGLETQLVPATAILSADGQVLRLAENWTEPSEEAQAAGLTLRADANVVSVEGKRLGKLRLVCFEPGSRVVTALVVARRGTEQRLLAIDRVKEAGPDRVVTDLRAADWAKLPLFATDWEIKQAFTEQLTDDPRLRAGQRSMTIDVQDQVVTLRGYVTDQSEAEELARIIRSVPSVLRVDRKLVTDADLARAVAAAIARDPAASAATVNVNAHYGTVDITGEAPDRATARAVERVAGQVPGVQVLHNMVAVRKPAGLAS